MTRPNKRYKIGHYGSGTLSCLKTQRAIYILFNSVRIAKTGLPDTSLAGRWILLEPVKRSRLPVALLFWFSTAIATAYWFHFTETWIASVGWPRGLGS